MNHLEIWQNLRVVSFHTDDENYTLESERLERSIQSFQNLPYTIKTIPAGPWKEACHKKPQLLLGFCEMFPDSPLLFVDADAVLEKDPRKELPNTWKKDTPLPPLSVHTFRKRLCSGTVIMAPGLSRIHVLKNWIKTDTRRGHLFSQPQRILHEVDGVDGRLDSQWCWIFDLSEKEFYDQKTQPIVTHYQASRQFRKDRKSNAALLQNRQKTLKERFREAS